jgi:hypothetical protein
VVRLLYFPNQVPQSTNGGRSFEAERTFSQVADRLWQ